LIVSDTHAFFWWLAGSSELSPRGRDLLERNDVVVVPAIVLWEIAMLAAKGRIILGVETTEYLERATTLPRVRVEPLSPRIAVRANAFGDTLHRDPADRLIVATAMELSAPLITKDAHIQAFGGVETVW